MVSKREDTPKEWNEARALLAHRLFEIEEKSKELEEKIAKQNELLSELRIKFYGISAGIATLVSIIGWLLTHFGISIGRK